MNYNKAVFENAYGVLSQLPESDEPEVVFAGRSRRIIGGSIVNAYYLYISKGLSGYHVQTSLYVTLRIVYCQHNRYTPSISSVSFYAKASLQPSSVSPEQTSQPCPHGKWLMSHN